MDKRNYRSAILSTLRMASHLDLLILLRKCIHYILVEPINLSGVRLNLDLKTGYLLVPFQTRVISGINYLTTLSKKCLDEVGKKLGSVQFRIKSKTGYHMLDEVLAE